MQRFKKVKSSDKDKLDVQYMPVPYNLDFTLYVMAKNSDDALQIVEQILPYFNQTIRLQLMICLIWESKEMYQSF